MRRALTHPRSKLLNWIWKLKLLPKIKFFLWLVIRNVIPTCVKLEKIINFRKNGKIIIIIIIIIINCHNG